MIFHSYVNVYQRVLGVIIIIIDSKLKMMIFHSIAMFVDQMVEPFSKSAVRSPKNRSHDHQQWDGLPWKVSPVFMAQLWPN